MTMVIRLIIRNWIVFNVNVLVIGLGETTFQVPTDVIGRAMCQAQCYDLFGEVSSKRFDVTENNENTNDCGLPNCKQCLSICDKEEIENCNTELCHDDEVCLKSCKYLRNFLEGLVEYKDLGDFVDTPNIICKNVPYGRNNSCPDTIATMYIRWSVRSRPVANTTVFIVSARYRNEKKSLSDWDVKTTTVSHFVELEKLYCSTDYQVQVTAVLANGGFSRSKPSNWSTTPGGLYEPPIALSMNISEPVLVNQKPSVTVTWDPGKDASCFFKIHWFDPQSHHQAEIKTPGKFRYRIYNLEFSMNYTIRLYSADDTFQHTSDERIMYILTPNCLEATSYNYTACGPLQPNNFTLEVITPAHKHIDTKYVNVSLSWQPPLYSHEGRDIILYHLTFRKQPPYDASRDIISHKGQITVSGTSLSATLYELHNHNQYRFELYANTTGGRGETTVLEKYIGLKSIDEGIGESTHAVYTAGAPDSLTFVELMIVVLIPTVLFLVIAFAIGFIIYKRRQKYKKYSSQRRYGPVEEMNPIYDGMISKLDGVKATQFDVDGYEIDYSCLDFISVIGEGAFGKVVKAEYYPNPADRGVKEGRIVAVKMLRDFYTGDESRNFLLEIQSMKNLGHFPYIVSIIGCCLTGPKLCLVMDYCALGDLRNYLRKYREKLLYNMSSPYSVMSKSPNCYMQEQVFSHDRHRSNSSTTSDGEEVEEISEAQLISYARQITMGMEFLAKRKFVHRDLAARNILLYDHRHIKISDFGLTRDVYETNVYQPTSARKLPYKWMALESLFSQRFTVHSDVWSFGIVLWEIVTLGGSPYPSIPLKDLYGLLNDGYRMEKPENCSDKLYQIMLSCWHPNPHSRPSFNQLKLELEKILEETMSYIDLSVEVSEDYYNDANDSPPAVNPLSASKGSTLELDSATSQDCREPQELCVDVYNEPKQINNTKNDAGVDGGSCSHEMLEHEDDENDYLHSLLSNTKCVVCSNRGADEIPTDSNSSKNVKNLKRCSLCSKQYISKSADALKEKSKHLVKSHFQDDVRCVTNTASSSLNRPVVKRVYASLNDIVDTKESVSTSV